MDPIAADEGTAVIITAEQAGIGMIALDAMHTALMSYAGRTRAGSKANMDVVQTMGIIQQLHRRLAAVKLREKPASIEDLPREG